MSEVLRQVLDGSCGDRLPFAPFVGGHAARVLGCAPRELYADPNSLAMSLLAVAGLYSIDGISVGFDLTAQARDMGLDGLWDEHTGGIVANGSVAADAEVVAVAAENVASQLRDRMQTMAVVLGPGTAALSASAGAAESTDMFRQAVSRALGGAQSRIHRLAPSVDLLVLHDPGLSQLDEQVYESAVRRLHRQICATARHYHTPVALVPGRLGELREAERYRGCGFQALVIHDEDLPQLLDLEVTPALGIRVPAAIFASTSADARAYAKSLASCLAERPAFLTTSAELPYDAASESISAFIDALR